MSGVAALLAAAPVVAAATEPEPAPAVSASGPELQDVVADPARVDVSRGAATVAVSAKLADSDGVASVSVRLGSGPSVVLALSAGSRVDGTWSGVATVPAFSPAGSVAAYISAMDMTGAVSSPVSGSPLTAADAVPAAPASISAVAAEDVADAVDVSWDAPAGNGGSAVTSYSIAVDRAPGTDDTALVPPAATVDASARTFTVTGLSSDARYVIRVAASNVVGSGPPLLADATTDPHAVTVPDAPTAVATRAGDRALFVAWTSPASSGGMALTAFRATATPRSVDVPPVSVDTGPEAVAAEVPGLVNGVTYDVAVSALNAVGFGLASGTAEGTPRTVPVAPAIATVTAHDGTATASWTPPASDGGAAVQAYVVTASNGTHVTVPGDVHSATVRGLANGVPATFTVAAVNVAGSGPASALSAAVVPFQAARFVVLTQPAGRVVHGTRSVVVGALRSMAGTGIAGQTVELQAKIRPSSTWTKVASSTTGAGGRVTFRVVLPATSALRLYHPLTTVQAVDKPVRSVFVATRVGAKPNTTRPRIGTTLTVRGGISAPHPVGAKVRLQRYSRGRWHNLATGRMTTTRSYVVTFTPRALDSHLLRVIKPSDFDHQTGISRRFWVKVVPESVTDIARSIRSNPRITLESTHDSGVVDLAHAERNVYDVARGARARRSAYQNAPGGLTALDRRILLALRYMGSRGTVTVSEIAGGSHAPRSSHYSGRAIDISWVNGVHVGPGAPYGLAVQACRKYGATHIWHPSYDPVGGHSHHVHCDWS